MWLDNNILVRVDAGDHAAEAELINLRKDGHEILISPQVEHEFLVGQVLSGEEKIPGLRPEDTARRGALLGRLHVTTDRMAARVPVVQLRQWVEEGTRNGLSLPDARMVAEVRASARVRGIREPVLLTLDGGGTLLAMRRRGVTALAFRVRPVRRAPVTPTHTQPVPGVIVPPPKSGSLKIMIGSTLAIVGLAAAFELIFGNPVEKRNDRHLQEAFERVAKEMDKWVNGNVRMVLDEVVENGKAYAVAELKITYIVDWVQPDIAGEVGYWGVPMLASDSVRIDSLYISSRSIEGETTKFPSTELLGLASSKLEKYGFTVSSPIPALPEDQVIYYRTMTNVIKSTRATGKHLSAASRQEITRGIEVMEEAIDERFTFDKFRPSDPKLWTEEGFARYSK